MKYTPSNEFRTLLDKLLDHPPLSHNETVQLETILEDDTALIYYLHIVQQESLMSEALLAPALDLPLSAKTGSSSIFYLKPIAWAAAACVLFGLGMHFGNKGLDKSATLEIDSPVNKVVPLNEELFPTITGMFGVRWADEGENRSIIPTTNNSLHLESGIIELTYPNGVQVVLEGPASFKASGGNGGNLEFGRLVASVPRGAEGFVVNYAHGKVVDLGTEFGMDVQKNGHADIGVFDGEVEVHAGSKSHKNVLLVTENKALRHLNQEVDNILSIPFDQSSFVRHTPSRELPWELDSIHMKELEFDVTHLIWRGGQYRALFKWMHGKDAIEIHQLTLCKNGNAVVTNLQLGCTGILGNTRNNIFDLTLADEDYSRAKWTIKALVAPKARANWDKTFEEVPAFSSGIMQLVEKMESNTSPAAFIGKWEYMHKGIKFVRTFKPDGKFDFTMGGKIVDSPKDYWTFEDNTLKLKFHNLNFTEDHMLLDSNTLIFTNQPYANAVKVDE